LEKLATSRLSSITGSHGSPDDASTRERSAWNTWYFGRVSHRRKPRGNPGDNLEGDEAVEALVKEFHQKYPQEVKDRRVSLE
jgi:hypothetical protein